MSITVPPDGPEPCDLVACGEAPSWDEEKAGRGWVGPAGKILWGGDYDLIGGIVGRPRETVRCTNVVKVRCPDSDWQEWTEEEREALYADLRLEIAAGEPKVVLAFGRRACLGLVPGFHSMRSSNGKPQMGYGKYIVMPLWHPAAALRGNSQVIPELAIALAMVPDLLKHGLPEPQPEPVSTDEFLEVEGETWPETVGPLLPEKRSIKEKCGLCGRVCPTTLYVGLGLKWRLCLSHAWISMKWARLHQNEIEDSAAIAAEDAARHKLELACARMEKALDIPSLP